MRTNEITMTYGTFCRYRAGKYYFTGGFGRLVDQMAQKYEKVYLMIPVTHVNPDEEFSEYCLQSPNVIVQELPSYRSYIDAVKRRKEIKQKIKEYSKTWHGLLYIRWMTVFFDYMYKCAKEQGLPVVFHIVEDGELVIRNGRKYTGIKKIVALIEARRNSMKMKKLMKTCPTLVNGSDMRRLYSLDNKLVKEIRTSTILKEEITYSHKKMDKSDVKLLFVGRIKLLKGLDYLLEAMKMLKEKGYNLSLTLVGEGDYADKLKETAEKIGLGEKIYFTGRLALGNEIMAQYKASDIFVLPSLSEGTPRALIEAMCNGVPVIGTNAGGIPFTITDKKNGLLIQMKDSKAIADAIETLIVDDKLRDRIVQNGYKFAEANTIESHAEDVYQFIVSNT